MTEPDAAPEVLAHSLVARIFDLLHECLPMLPKLEASGAPESASAQAEQVAVRRASRRGGGWACPQEQGNVLGLLFLPRFDPSRSRRSGPVPGSSAVRTAAVEALGRPRIVYSVEGHAFRIPQFTRVLATS